MKYLLSLLVIFVFQLVSGLVFAQSPDRINYQAIARDSESGQELANQSVFLIAKIIQTSPDGEIVYQEEHPNIQTNSYGLFNIEIGGGSPIQGSMDDINWFSNSFWLEVDIDLGDGLETAGSMQFVSVPYAFHAKTVENPNDADADPTNELIDGLNFDEANSELTVTQGDQQLSVNLGSLINDADSDPTNELVYEFNFNPESNNLTITQEGEDLSVNLGDLINDADADPTNEVITNFELDGDFLIINESEDWAVSLNQFYDDADADPQNELIDDNGLQLSATNLLTISEAGISHSVDLAPLVNDADFDPNNETILDDGLQLIEDTILQITEAGTVHQLNLASLRDDGDWSESNSGDVFNTNARIGIGTNSPTSDLDVKGSMAINYVILDNEVQNSYTVTSNDHLIVFKLSNSGVDPFQITLPDAADFEGRVIEFVRKGPTGIDIEVFFSGSDLDFEAPSIPYDFGGTLDGATKFVSLGAEGWIRIDI